MKKKSKSYEWNQTSHASKNEHDFEKLRFPIRLNLFVSDGFEPKKISPGRVG